MSVNTTDLMVLGLVINFMALVLGFGSLLFALFRFWVQLEARLSRLETNMSHVLHQARPHQNTAA